MKSRLILTTLVIAITIGVIATGSQQVSAPRECGSCVHFKKLTHEFEKNVMEAATSGDPNLIPNLLEQYNEDVRALDLAPKG